MGCLLKRPTVCVSVAMFDGLTTAASSWRSVVLVLRTLAELVRAVRAIRVDSMNCLMPGWFASRAAFCFSGMMLTIGVLVKQGGVSHL